MVLQVLGEVDRRHPAAAELTLDSVALGEGSVRAGEEVGQAATRTRKMTLSYEPRWHPARCGEARRIPEQLADRVIRSPPHDRRQHIVRDQLPLRSKHDWIAVVPAAERHDQIELRNSHD